MTVRYVAKPAGTVGHLVLAPPAERRDVDGPDRWASGNPENAQALRAVLEVDSTQAKTGWFTLEHALQMIQGDVVDLARDRCAVVAGGGHHRRMDIPDREQTVTRRGPGGTDEHGSGKVLMQRQTPHQGAVDEKAVTGWLRILRSCFHFRSGGPSGGHAGPPPASEATFSQA